MEVKHLQLPTECTYMSIFTGHFFILTKKKSSPTLLSQSVQSSAPLVSRSRKGESKLGLAATPSRSSCSRVTAEFPPPPAHNPPSHPPPDRPRVIGTVDWGIDTHARMHARMHACTHKPTQVITFTTKRLRKPKQTYLTYPSATVGSCWICLLLTLLSPNQGGHVIMGLIAVRLLSTTMMSLKTRDKL